MEYLKSAAVWLLLMCAETLHGTLRIFLLAPTVGDFRARQIAVFTGALIIFVITTACIKWIKPTKVLTCLFIGAFWVLLTLGFEISLGLFAFNMSLTRILEDYNLPQGGLMPIGLLLMFFTPLAAAKTRKLI